MSGHSLYRTVPQSIAVSGPRLLRVCCPPLPRWHPPRALPNSSSSMVPPPKRLDSVEVTNNTASACTVSVLFDNHKESIDLQEDHQIAAGESYHFAEKILDMGSWTAVAPVKKVSVSHANGDTHHLEPSVNGVVKKLAVAVQANGHLAQGSSIE